MEGYLCKQGKRMKQWWKRYFILDGHTLRYFSQKGGVLRAEIEVLGCSAKVVHKFLIGRDYTFQIAATETFLVVCASTDAEMHEWIRALNEASGGTGHRDGMLSPGSAMVALAARRQDDEIYNVLINERRHLRDLMVNFHTRNDKLILAGNIEIKDTTVSGGSVLVAINGKPVIEDDFLTIQDSLHRASFPITLQFLRVKRRHGILRIMPYEGLNNVFSSWKERLCVLDGENFTYLRKNDVCDKTEIPLHDCTVKVVHKFLAGRDFCFMICSRVSHLLFQALSSDDMLQWIGAVAHAAEVANGRIMNSGFCSQKQSKTPTKGSCREDPQSRHLGGEGESSRSFSDLEDDVTETLEVELRNEKPFLEENSSPAEGRVDCSTKAALEQPSTGSTSNSVALSCKIQCNISQPTETHPNLPVAELVAYYQCREKMVEAIQLMRKNPVHRREYWLESFAWALEPTTMGYFNSLLQTKLIQRDVIQLTKDVPRTTNWLEHSSGVGKLDKKSSAIRLKHLRNVLHAYIASCAIGEGSLGKEESAPSAYLQGMNGITFVLLQAFDEDEGEAFRFLTGIVEKLLPSIFESDSFGQETLGQTGQFFESIIASYLPEVVEVFERVGLPVFILAYKWFPTLFSDISLTAGNRQMPYNTILAAWDVCFLMGMDGAICVALALFAAAQGVLLSLPRDCLAEDVGFALNNVLAALTPEWLLDGVCVVIETCNDVKLKKLRFQHMKQLHRSMKRKSKTHATTHAMENPSPLPSASDCHVDCSANTVTSPMMARNLDTGEVFVISESGMTLAHVGDPQ